MGNICDCLQSKQSVTAKTPLLYNQQQQVPSNPKEVSNAAAITGTPGQSARRFKPDDRGFETSLEMLSQVTLARIPTMPALDKTFQDHAKLFNDLYVSFTSLRDSIHQFKSQFVVETSGIPVLTDCLRILATRCGGAALTGSRTKHCIEILFDKREVSQRCTGPAEDVLETLELYNKANRSIKRLLDKGPQVQNSIQLVLDEEHKLKKEVTKMDPDGKFGPEPLRMTVENFTKLRKLPAHIDTIQKYTNRIFEEICRGSKPLFATSES